MRQSIKAYNDCERRKAKGSNTFSSMEANDSIYNPMEIIKQIRGKRYGGNISSMEYAYLLKALLAYFFENKMLIGGNNGRINFAKEYENYVYKLDASENLMDKKVKNFLKYVNINDAGKLNELCVQFNNIGMMSKDALINNCQRFYTAKESLLRRNRYNDIECLDKTSVNINGYDSKNILGYIHANEMIYKYGEGNERKIIMCQAPIQTTVDDMYDMIFRYKIGIIVILVNEKEIKVQNKLNIRSCILIKKTDNVNRIIEYDYTILNFFTTLIDPIQAYLLKVVLFMNSIHCSTGIGRTGTLALAIYMINYGKRLIK
ncbi:Protein-tyrosine phosphatase, receptor/non-receptor type domain and Protein-tyrosine/Dual specificity phosphatase domain-containing protein [Strongyloides ratti]|uniref:Protein-tyrosine phosphatase, receptor/non-receptor type domain and Protein-tyrosine/Dual specificity phosphatase domain-containing protein n=1 Tax=Strongyloides ratti TaxID=34506 RepID=A0A090L4C6_STRRB|nr:Protein-tyrosine phosphatase, receptor/non-receptor type domain and Protein-tyrosine/Dual specificity phosphatase domain-containing protein [Strongyloides ratti]CEF62972.2 Protein-tyrosine phosphatase, receptor/non-receptor type domain and Protein-tyrosine/Dual specificity phosphatase domain-containing protein [Strongyloides ratti]